MKEDKFPDLASQKIQQSLSQLRSEEDKIYRQALEKRFGNSTDESAKKCSISIDNYGVKSLMYGEETLCLIYPPKQNSFLGSSAQTQVTLSQNYKIL